jgi:D-citramalate synthase
MDSISSIAILDTTLRDGEQTQGVSFSAVEKTNIAKILLEHVRVDRLEVASARVSEGELKAVAAMIEWAAPKALAHRIEVLGFIDQGRSAQWIQRAGGQVINLLAKGSERHCVTQLKKTLATHTADICSEVQQAQDIGLTVNLYLEDWSNGYQDNPSYVYELMEHLRHLKIAHFMLPDTLGVMTPERVYQAIVDMRQRFPECAFDFHPHNDYGLATANVLAAVRAGVSTVHCTVNCLGERAGNASLAEVVVNLRDQLGIQVAIDERYLVQASDVVQYFSGKRIADNAPIIGTDVFTQTAGIHADGDKKGSLYHSCLSPERFGRRRVYALGKLSGKASLAKNLERLNITLTEEQQRKVLARIIELGDSKKTITTEDLPFIIAEVFDSGDYDHAELLACNVSSSFGLESTASIKLRLDDELLTATGSGNGGFDAFNNALEQIVKRQQLTLPVLVDYEVRIPKGGRTDALTECIITWHQQERDFKTRGVHANQVFAAISAAMRMLNLVIHWSRCQRDEKDRQHES